jgi:Na+/phosphate symporter
VEELTLQQIAELMNTLGIVGYLGMFIWFFFTAKIYPASEIKWRNEKIERLEKRVDELQTKITELLERECKEAEHQLEVRNAEFMSTIRNLESYQAFQDSLAQLVLQKKAEQNDAANGIK